MGTLNRVFLLGNLTGDPEVKVFDNGSTVTNFGLAVNSRYKAKDGKEKTETCFMDVVVWGNQAKACADYLRKGSQVLVEGRLVFEEWDDRETGKRRTHIRVRADSVQFLNKPQRRDTDVNGVSADQEPEIGSQTRSDQ